MQNVERTAIVSLKAYGDFLIALSAVRKLGTLPGRHRPLIITGHYMEPLVRTLRCNDEVAYVIRSKTDSVPATFNVRATGPVAALRSMLEIRDDLRRFSLRQEVRFVFDCLGWRERFISGFTPAVGLPKSENIYLAYEQLWRSMGYAPSQVGGGTLAKCQTAVIFPGSRLQSKALPPEVLSQVVALVRSFGLSPQIAVVSGDPVSLPADLRATTVERRFPALMRAFEAADCVISADSLTAHLGEHFGLPTFVISRLPNRYWLPARAFSSRWSASYEDLSPLRAWLESLR